MAKATKPKINVGLLSSIAAAVAVNQNFYISEAEGLPLVNNDPKLIDVNPALTDPTNPTKVAARLTPAGEDYLQKNGKGVAPAAAVKSPFEIINGAVLPTSKRGGSGAGAPKLYPFDQLEVGQTFFVPVSEKHTDPVKMLGSTVSSANQRFSEPTGEMKKVSRTKRGPGNKAVKDAAGNNIKEEVEIAVRKPTRKFSIRAVKAGEVYGTFTAPADGALIGRVSIEA